MNVDDMKALAERTVLVARSRGADTVEVTVSNSREIEVSARKDAVETLTDSAASSIAVTLSIDRRKASFTSMGRGIVYLPVSYENKEIVPLAPPFILRADCNMTQLAVDSTATTSVLLTGTTERAVSASTETIKSIPLKKGQEYELHYWQDGWQLHQSFVADTGEISIGDLPSGGLHWLVATGSGRDERIFTVEDGRQLFW